MLSSDEIHDTVRDDIDLPQEMVEGGVYSMDGELMCVNPQAGLQTMNQYAIHRNNLQSVARASARTADALDAANPVVYLKGS